MTVKKTSRKKTKITAEDLYRFNQVTSLAISPDEKMIAYTVERMDKKEMTYFTNIHINDIKNNKCTQFTHGNYSDSQPAWSHDGNTLAFVSTRDKKTGIYIMPVSGGAEKKLIEIEGSISSLQFTPDDHQLVFSLMYSDSHFIKDEKKKKKQPVFRHITNLFYRLDGVGFMPKAVNQIFSLNISSLKLKQLTHGKRHNESPSVSPDGKYVAFVSNRARNWEFDILKEDVFIVPIKGGKEKRVPTPPGTVASPVFSPDSKKIAYMGHDDTGDFGFFKNYHVWTVGVNGRPAARDLMPKFDRAVFDSSIADMDDTHFAGGLAWSGDGKRVFFLSSDRGVTNLFSISTRGGIPTRIYNGKCHVKHFSVNGTTRTVGMVIADLTNPGDIYTTTTQYGGEKKAVRKTNMNQFLKKEIDLGKTKEVWFKSFDGTKIQGWLATPPGFNPNKKYPAIFQVHGGPQAQYAFSFFHEMRYLTAKGYVVFYTNPRGGSGRGEMWSSSISADWGGLDYKDCMAAADWMENQKFINSNKIGVTGGSYGGFMTNWLIGHTNRFKAAVTQRSVVDLKSFIGSSDFGFVMSREFGGFPWNNPETYEKCSPITYFKNVRTPVLIIHSEQDLRCAIEQAEQMFVMLKSMGRKVELVRFPEEPHGLSRHGRPDRRIARLEWIAKWFDKYL